MQAQGQHRCIDHEHHHTADPKPTVKRYGWFGDHEDEIADVYRRSFLPAFLQPREITLAEVA